MRHRSHRPDRRYAAIPNAVMRDENLSIEARGMLALLMTYADDWEFHSPHLMRVAGVKPDRFQRIMRELTAAGFVTREPIRCSETGKLFGTRWIIHDEPDSDREPENTVIGDTENRKNRPLVKPTAGKSGPIRRPRRKEDQIIEGQPSKKIGFDENWKPDNELRRWAKSQGFTDEDIEAQAKLCALHHIAKGTTFKDLGAAWKTWMLRAKKYRDDELRKAGPVANGNSVGRGLLDRVAKNHGDWR
ncbi:hypothetical protein [Sinisalibacter lacisalsi]|uniref:Helix-turn-helix domain-containing protein n=1 Tax=Sinisalibacter lacisalsi TaxID=1526570 RepID=A0ABQ1QMF9_9RHOB|nr:hypothetical protein [Sinisalibacter lacisalsi]GGD30802.1 hypothetical protein GCM10011358_13550 [Sinisalibacter lacisalsi]